MTKSWSVTSGDEHGELVAGELGELGLLRQHGLDAIADLDQQPVAGHRAERVVDLLEGHQVQEHQGHAQAARRGRPGWRSRGAPGASCGSAAPSPGRAAPGTPSPCASCCSVATSRPLARATLAWLAKRLEEPQVVLDERADLGEPVGHDHRPHRQAVGGQRNDRRILHPHLAQPPRQRLPRLEEPRRVVRQEQRQIRRQLSRRDVGARRSSSPRITRRVAGALGRTGGRRRAPCSPRRISRAPSTTACSSSVDLDRIAERPGEVVQRLQVLVTLGEPRERAVEHEQHGTTTPTTSKPEVRLVPERADEHDARASCSRWPRGRRRRRTCASIRRPGKPLKTVIASVTERCRDEVARPGCSRR